MEKNKQVKGHTVSLILRCGHEISEPLEAMIYLPSVGETRYCVEHERQSTIVKVGQPVWNDRED